MSLVWHFVVLPCCFQNSGFWKILPQDFACCRALLSCHCTFVLLVAAFCSSIWLIIPQSASDHVDDAILYKLKISYRIFMLGLFAFCSGKTWPRTVGSRSPTTAATPRAPKSARGPSVATQGGLRRLATTLVGYRGGRRPTGAGHLAPRVADSRRHPRRPRAGLAGPPRWHPVRGPGGTLPATRLLKRETGPAPNTGCIPRAQKHRQKKARGKKKLDLVLHFVPAIPRYTLYFVEGQARARQIMAGPAGPGPLGRKPRLIHFSSAKVDLRFLSKECWSPCEQDNSKENCKCKNLC